MAPKKAVPRRAVSEKPLSKQVVQPSARNNDGSRDIPATPVTADIPTSIPTVAKVVSSTEYHRVTTDDVVGDAESATSTFEAQVRMRISRPPEPPGDRQLCSCKPCPDCGGVEKLRCCCCCCSDSSEEPSGTPSELGILLRTTASLCESMAGILTNQRRQCTKPQGPTRRF